MSQFQETHLPCEDCGSSDARAVYHSGVSICFSCGTRTAPEREKGLAGKLPFLETEPFSISRRSIQLNTFARYGYSMSKCGNWHVAPYYDQSGRLVAQKLRGPHKKFSITGDAAQMGLFGLHLARRNGKAIVVTEGEIDAMSISQALGNTWPVVSLPNGASNLKPLVDSLEFLETYDKVVLCFDNDPAGQKATEVALELFSPGKVHTMNLGTHKDANEALVADYNLRSAVWEAKQYRPDGIVQLSELKERILKPLEQGFDYPWKGLNKMLYGFRPQELITWCAGTGVGKTAIVSEIVYDMLVRQGLRVGIIYLEEGVVRSARRLIGLHCNAPLHLPENEVSEETFDAAFESTVGTGRLVAWDHFGSVDVELLANRVRYMRHAFGVDVVVLDHISMVVSGADIDADERRLLDKAMTSLRSLTQETGLCIHNVSHLNRRSGDKPHEEGASVTLANLRGTQAIGQLSDAVIAAERNQQAAKIEDRNMTMLRVLKNRYAGITGPAERLSFDPTTGRLEAVGLGEVEEVALNMGEVDF